MKAYFTIVVFCAGLLPASGQTKFLNNPKVISQIFKAIQTNKTASSFTPAESVGADALWAKGFEGEKNQFLVSICLTYLCFEVDSIISIFLPFPDRPGCITFGQNLP